MVRKVFCFNNFVPANFFIIKITNEKPFHFFDSPPNLSPSHYWAFSANEDLVSQTLD